MLCPRDFEESGERRWHKQSSIMSLGSTGGTRMLIMLIIDSYYLLLWNLDFSVTPSSWHRTDSRQVSVHSNK